MPGSESDLLDFNTGQQLLWKPVNYIENSGSSSCGKDYSSQEAPNTQDQTRFYI